jgi:Zn-dependent M16 (insulinase) family peptidase
VGLGVNLYDMGYCYHGSVHVILKYLRAGWLWEKVRVQGGAYGAFCSLDRMTGALVLVSYRDPNITDTLDVFARSAGYLQRLTLEKSELSAAIVGAVGEVDSYLLPDAKGSASFLRALAGDTQELRQRMRDEILGTTQAHFRFFGEALGSALPQGRSCVLGGAALEKAANGGGWDTLRLL